MNNVMKRIIKNCDNYRLILIDNKEINKQCYKVQFKFLCFWVTVKTFKLIDYGFDYSFCCVEAKELYYKLIDYYGKF